MLSEIYNRSIKLVPTLGLIEIKPDAAEDVVIASMLTFLRALRKTKPNEKLIQAIDDHLLMLENYKSLNGDPEEIFNNIYSFLEAGQAKKKSQVHQEIILSDINFELKHLHKIYEQIYKSYSQHGSNSTQMTPKANLKTEDEYIKALLKFVRIMDPSILEDFMTADTYALLISLRKDLQNDNLEKIPLLRHIAQIYCDTFNLHYSELKYAHDVNSNSTKAPTQWFDYKDNESAYSKLYNRYVRLANSFSRNSLYVNPKLSDKEICDSLLRFVQTLDLQPLENEDLTFKQAILISHDKESTQQNIYNDLENLANDLELILNNKPSANNNKI